MAISLPKPTENAYSHSHARSCCRLNFNTLWHEYACSCMPASGVIWFDLVGLWPREREFFSILVNHLSFLHQLSDEPADGSVTNIITYSVCICDIIIIHAFLLVIEMQMCGRVIFGPAESHLFDPNSAASRALELNSLLSHSLILSYQTLEYQPLVVTASMRT